MPLSPSINTILMFLAHLNKLTSDYPVTLSAISDASLVALKSLLCLFLLVVVSSKALLRKSSCCGFFTIALSLCLSALSVSATAQTMATSTITPYQLILLVAAIGLLIIALSLSVRRNKKIKRRLKDTQRELEAKVTQRTHKLREINNRLYDVINEHEQTRQQLIESETYTESILQSMPSAVIGVDINLIVTRWNQTSEHLTGTSFRQAIGKPLSQCYKQLPFTVDLLLSAIKEHRVRTLDVIDVSVREKKQYLSAVIYPLTAGNIVGAVIRIDDITQRIKLENMLIQDEKLLSLGRMAAGLAHEINNPLAAITQSRQTIERRLLHNDLMANQQAAENLNISFGAIQDYIRQREVDTLLNDLKESVDRAAHVVKTMLDFSHTSQLEHEAFNVIAMINNSITIAEQEFSPTMRTAIKITTSAGNLNQQSPQDSSKAASPNTNYIAFGSLNEIQQVLVNLLSNAADAMQTVLDNDSQHEYQPSILISLSQTANLIRIDVSDNGPGIPEASRNQVFEPFFTTKEVGQGTGLGLSISYFIMTEHHRGALDLMPSINSGARFRLSLPLRADTSNIVEPQRTIVGS